MSPSSSWKTGTARAVAIVDGSRVFKTRWFAKAAVKRGISDSKLCVAIAEVQRGLAVDLGGGVWKKRLNDNRDRSIVLAKGGRHWFFAYLFQKNERDNIEDDELAAFKKLAKEYEKLNEEMLSKAIAGNELMEICRV